MGGDTPDFRPDARAVLKGLHQRVTSGLLDLMEGLYSNIEDSLFELAYRNEDVAAQRRCFDLMRELRYRRAGLLKLFAAGMDRNLPLWFDQDGAPTAREVAIEAMAAEMARGCNTHFAFLLSEVAERVGLDSTPEENARRLPIAPDEIAYHFMHSLRALEFDDASVAIVRELFTRFVLDRLGTLYGECNGELARAGYLTRLEREVTTRARA